MKMDSLFQLFVEQFNNGWAYGFQNGLIFGVGIGAIVTICFYAFLRYRKKAV